MSLSDLFPGPGAYLVSWLAPQFDGEPRTIVRERTHACAPLAPGRRHRRHHTPALRFEGLVMNYVEKLTPEQLALLPKQRDKWIKIGLSTEPADRARAEEGVRKAYRAAGLKPPRSILWVDSPLAGAYARVIAPRVLAQYDQVGGQVDGQVYGQVRGQVYGQVGGQVRGQVRDQVRDQVDGQVYGQVRDQVDGQVRGQVGDQVDGQDLADWTKGLNGYWGWSVGFTAWIDTFALLGVTGLEPWDGQAEIAQHSGFFWWSYTDFAILTERFVELHRDAQGRLHNASGPAVLYRDGFAVFAWHGVRVPQDMIETDWSVDQILREPNAEIRRCAIEKIGWDRLVDSMGLTPVATSPDPGNPGQVIDLYDLPRQVYDEPVRLIVVANGTVESDGRRRRFGLTVPAEISDPVAAAAWTYDVPKEMYLTIAARR